MTPVELVLGMMMVLAPVSRPVERYGEIAQAIAAEASDPPPNQEPEEFGALLVAVAFRESSFRNDVSSKTGDHCVMQVHGRPDLKNDVRACVRVRARMLRESVRICGLPNILGLYAE